MHAAENDPGDRQGKDLAMQTGVEARLQPVVIVIVEVEAARTKEHRQTERNGDQPAANPGQLWKRSTSSARFAYLVRILQLQLK